jgi:hypothetical protein
MLPELHPCSGTYIRQGHRIREHREDRLAWASHSSCPNPNSVN